MSRLTTLIRLHRWQLNEQRRRVVELETLAEAARGRIVALDEAVAAEGRHAEMDLTIRATYPAYVAAARERRNKLCETLATLSGELAEAQEAVTIAFQELKKYELAEEAKQRREREFLARRDTIRLDEMAAQGFQRSVSGD